MSAVPLTAEQNRETAAVAEVIAAGRAAALRHWVPATSGNFSVRINADRVAITRSGVDKGALTSADILIQPLDAPLLPRSSAEAPLHLALYRRDPSIGAIFHVHAPGSTVLSRVAGPGGLRLTGWELQKALPGITSHEQAIEVPVFANDQDTDRLAGLVEARLAAPTADGALLAPGYLLAGHGLYAWGTSPKEAARHLEALETLFEFELSYRRFTP
ncbi:methylthioribulose-1-phosphate dehydratase [Kaistia soli DSM 19436]|uniref:Methylthioribulose-1-phosphate dehydratase n=1 Tax=Kaistia soli DSM 19436 TaxID=1122133 RepID=A0A1M4XF04_9HYPH|nr:methylthioribulose 1-phosphate dehydratase [Kaistia soli]SHE91923.1 methylthioribulose-1-phosphate dehydratase [Kaistia soli DSM 19436]